MSLFYRKKLTDSPTDPLLVIVHGRAGNKDVMWTFQRTFPENCSIVAPEAPTEDPIGGFSWWNVQNGMNRDDVNKAVDILQSFISEFIISNSLKPSKIIAVGFSQGAALLSILIQRYPGFLSSAALLAGFVFIEESNSRSVNDLPKIFIAHGTNDQTVSIIKAYEGRDWLISKGYDVVFYEDPVGHKVGAQGMRELKNFLISQL